MLTIMHDGVMPCPDAQLHLILSARAYTMWRMDMCMPAMRMQDAAMVED